MRAYRGTSLINGDRVQSTTQLLKQYYTFFVGVEQLGQFVGLMVARWQRLA